MDENKIKQGVRLLLEGMGEDPEREGLVETPERIAKMYREIYGGLMQDASYLWLRRFQRKIRTLCWKKILHFFLLVNIICCRFMERRMWHIFRTERSLA